MRTCAGLILRLTDTERFEGGKKAPPRASSIPAGANRAHDDGVRQAVHSVARPGVARRLGGMSMKQTKVERGKRDEERSFYRTLTHDHQILYIASVAYFAHFLRERKRRKRA